MFALVTFAVFVALVVGGSLGWIAHDVYTARIRRASSRDVIRS